MNSARRLLFALFIASTVAACSGDDEAPTIPCNEEELWDHVGEECVPRYRDGFDTPDMGGGESPEDAGGGDDTPDLRVEPDMSEPDEGGQTIDPECDRDGDGVPSIECGGLDCDDDDRLRSPNIPELCDNVDNDCDGVNNEALNCTFYAHSSDTIYLIDPFEKTMTEVSQDAPSLLDIDTHPNGTLLGVAFDGLWELDELRNEWWFVGEFKKEVSDPNGFAIDSTGTAFVTSRDQIYTVDISDGSAELLGDLGADYYSSGDCVVNKRDSLYMTSKHAETEDHLLLVNRESGAATDVGPIGFSNVFALTAAWGTLYGLTDAGELIEIDTTSGAGTLIHQFPDVRFYGAASTPSR